jgi:hypothetical protein
VDERSQIHAERTRPVLLMALGYVEDDSGLVSARATLFRGPRRGRSHHALSPPPWPTPTTPFHRF